jgi:uncharacterized membrane protein YdfJ with MMPL/SSD domain
MGKIKLSILIAIIVVIALVVLAIILVPNTKLGRGPEIKITPLNDVSIAKEIYGFSGEIKVIKGKVLTLEASIPLADESAGLTKAIVKVAVNDQTKLVKMKFPAQPTEKNEPVFPEETTLNFSELKLGDKVNVAFPENVSDKLKAGEQLIANDLFIVEK